MENQAIIPIIAMTSNDVPQMENMGIKFLKYVQNKRMHSASQNFLPPFYIPIFFLSNISLLM